ncbi:MAG TPA: putative DNA base hypermodification protein [Sedimentisphaerales bacterium]|nr:putative DNA base hypermodification protein [Sedimentisphaerales bacterium]
MNNTLACNEVEHPELVKKDWAPAIPTVIFDTYWRFAAERQAIFYRRIRCPWGPWTKDPILQEYKFTNVYRASDRVSQYLIRNVIYEGDQSLEEVFFRIILFKLFNKIETWELLQRELNCISYAEYSFKKYDKILSHAMDNKHTIYSAAYIMPSGGSSFGYPKKHSNHLKLIEKMMKDRLYKKIHDIPKMAHAFELLRSYPTIGDFLAYQLVTDFNYSEIIDFSEMEFVVPGPGAKSGIKKCFASLGGLTEPEIILRVTKRQNQEFERLGLYFETIGGRPLQLIDCQNLFCEVDKYSRVAYPEINGLGRTRIKQKFNPKLNPINYWYPPKWGINESFEKSIIVRE